MASAHYSTANGSINNDLGLGDTDSSWPTAIWPTEPFDQQPYFDSNSGIPRSMQRCPGEMDLSLLANDIHNFEPSVSIPPTSEIPTLDYDHHHFSPPVMMTRTSFDISGHRLVSTDQHQRQHRHTFPSNGTINRKRDFYQIDMAYSDSSPADWPSTSDMTTTTTTSTRAAQLNYGQIYRPDDYCSKLANDEAIAMHFVAANKQQQQQQRIDSSGASPPQSSTYAAAPPYHASTPSSSSMSRTSSGASSRDALDMMRAESSHFSTTSSDLVPEKIDNGSFVSCATTATARTPEKPTSSAQSTTTAGTMMNNGNAVVGHVSTMNLFPFHSHCLPAATAAATTIPAVVDGQQSVQTARGTESPFSSSPSSASSASYSSDDDDSDKLSNTTTSIGSKASTRRRKHIENSQKSIAPRKMFPRSSSFSAKNQTSISSTTITTKKQLIFKTTTKPPYTRPRHPKLYCTICAPSSSSSTSPPQTFRGDHELRRHFAREHAPSRKVWICVQPPPSHSSSSSSSDSQQQQPAKPLNSCKQCTRRKFYNVYYNAAAHLRRAHFCPRKRGKAEGKGEEEERRAGKAGGGWPAIEWLKEKGWLMEIEVENGVGGGGQH